MWSVGSTHFYETSGRILDLRYRKHTPSVKMELFPVTFACESDNGQEWLEPCLVCYNFMESCTILFSQLNIYTICSTNVP